MKWLMRSSVGVVLMLSGLTVAAEEAVFVGREGHVRAVLLTDIDSLPLNRIHTWKVRFEAVDGSILADEVSLIVAGGMPAHDHGLPTEPQAIAAGDGMFRVEGLRFHMHGAWELIFEVRMGRADDLGAETDTVKVSFEL